MLPPAPGLFSITKVWPIAMVILCAMMREMVSEEPPAENGTMRRTGFSGYPWACAPKVARTSASRASRDFMVISCQAMRDRLTPAGRRGSR